MFFSHDLLLPLLIFITGIGIRRRNQGLQQGGITYGFRNQFLGAGLAIGLSVIGGALGQGKAATAALEGIARNPGAAGKIVTPMIIGLAMIESLVIYGLIVSLLMIFKL